eukprot:361880-Chlamydomonas_euryale.AAC.5
MPLIIHTFKILVNNLIAGCSGFWMQQFGWPNFRHGVPNFRHLHEAMPRARPRTRPPMFATTIALPVLATYCYNMPN